MSDHAEPAFVCRHLTADETAAVQRLAPAIAARFAALGHPVHICQGSGAGTYRVLAFLSADGRNVAGVRAGDLLDAPDHLAAGLVSSMVG